ncbi:pentatricopeptide repeat-containing protein At4g39530-like [Malania oleifera]|uniref:pentatricopeptide repeat-containing protein At4g39530-like n=1 Tax=Malania oleifera TaxID=397392 RepID=UPI0025ADCD39|nr:pentatricopeptide repeat-containing protein At4g39530-like [Malania oleifera]
MSLRFCLKPGLPQPSQHQCQSPLPVSNTKLSTRNLSLHCSTIQKLEGVVAAKAPKSHHVAKSDWKVQNQALVDLLRDSSAKGSIREGHLVHGYLLKSNLDDEESLFLFNNVVSAYCNCSKFEHARRLFDEMPERDVVSWTVMIVGSTRNGCFLDGFEFFCNMLIAGILPDEFAYSAIAQACVGLDCIELGEGVHGQIVKRGFSSNVIVGTSLVNMYAKLGNNKASVCAFNAIGEHNQVSWSAMISGLTANSLYLEAFNYFLGMKAQGVLPNMYALSSVLKAVGKLRDVGKGREVHHYIDELGMESNVVLGTSLINMYSKCGYLSEARAVFDMNFSKSRVSNPWNAMISGYLQVGFWSEALEIFTEMRLNDVQPDFYTYSSVFSAVAALKQIQFGRQVHGMVVKSGSDSRYRCVSNAIVDAYSKCHSLGEARRVFDKMVERDVVSWSTLVTAYAQSDRVEEALNIFSQMRDEGFAPNQYTFSSVIVGCARLCLLDYGRQLHGLLCKVGLDTDNCIESSLIVFYAKSDNIINAIKVFERIVCPDVVSWTAIISGCAQHGFSDKAVELFKRMEKSGTKPNASTLLMHPVCFK